MTSLYTALYADHLLTRTSLVGGRKTVAHRQLPFVSVSFLDDQLDVLAKSAQLLANLPVTSADHERSFSLARYADYSYGHSLPNNTWHLTNVLLFNKDVDGTGGSPAPDPLCRLPPPPPPPPP